MRCLQSLQLFLSSPRNTGMGIVSTAASLTRQITVLVLVLSLISPPGVVNGFGVCRSSFRCLNNGVAMYGTSVFGSCRCICGSGYTGPRCQYRLAGSLKRSDVLSGLTSLIESRRRQQQQREIDDITYYRQNVRDVSGRQRRRSRTRLHPRFFKR